MGHIWLGNVTRNSRNPGNACNCIYVRREGEEISAPEQRAIESTVGPRRKNLTKRLNQSRKSLPGRISFSYGSHLGSHPGMLPALGNADHDGFPGWAPRSGMPFRIVR